MHDPLKKTLGVLQAVQVLIVPAHFKQAEAQGSQFLVLILATVVVAGHEVSHVLLPK